MTDASKTLEPWQQKLENIIKYGKGAELSDHGIDWSLIEREFNRIISQVKEGKL